MGAAPRRRIRAQAAPRWRSAAELRPRGKGGKGHGGERDDENRTTYRVPGKHVAVAWLCLWAVRPTATILRVFILVPGHQISRRCTVYGSGASAPHGLHLWPWEEPWTSGGRGGTGLMRAVGQCIAEVALPTAPS